MKLGSRMKTPIEERLKIVAESEFIEWIQTQDDEAVALCQFVNNRYWTRLWIVQEILLARKVLVIYGSRSLKWEKLAEFCFGLYLREWMAIDHAAISGKGLLHLLEHTRIRCIPHEYHGNDIHYYRAKPYESYCETCHLEEFSRIIRDFCRHDCREPHDSVYGLIGLFEEAGWPWKYHVDYSHSPRHLFIDLVTALFKMLKTLKIRNSHLDAPTITAIEGLASAMDIRVVGGFYHDRVAIVYDRKAQGLPESGKTDINHETWRRLDMEVLLREMASKYYDAHYEEHKSEQSLRQELGKRIVCDGASRA